MEFIGSHVQSRSTKGSQPGELLCSELAYQAFSHTWTQRIHPEREREREREREMWGGLQSDSKKVVVNFLISFKDTFLLRRK